LKSNPSIYSLSNDWSQHYSKTYCCRAVSHIYIPIYWVLNIDNWIT
jgi:hypothetical protein